MSDLNNSVLLDFSPSKHPHLVNHVVSGNQPTLSAATLLCSLIENQHNNSQLHQITFLSTIQLEKGKQLKLVEDEDYIQVISNDGTIVLSAKTVKSTANLNVIEEELMSPANFPLHSTDIDLVLAEKFYSFMNNVGYRHKDDFQLVHWLELRINDDKAYGTVVFNSSPNLDCQLDSLWQTIAYALLSTKTDSQRELLVPFCIRSLKSKSLQKLSTEWICSGRFVVNLRENYGNFMLFNGMSNEVLMIGEEIIFLPKTADEVKSNEAEDEYKLQQENSNKIEKMREENATKMTTDLQKIGIRSISCRLPGNVKSPEDFWELLESTRSTDQKIPAERISNRNELIRGQLYGNPIEGGNFLDEDVSLFDGALFSLSQNEANAADAQQRFALTCGYECLEKAGLIVDDRENLRNLGIFVGMMGTEYYCEDANTNNALMMLGASASIACGRISHFLDSRGISTVVDTACSSSLVALDMARSHLLDGRIDKALVIGVNLILSGKAMGQRANGKLLSVDGRCKSFDAQADGYGRADGCVAILIERAQDGRQYDAFIEATNTNHDGKSAALTVPNGASHIELIQKCMESVKDLKDKSIAFWEIHGTGTALGDPIEVNSLQKALSKYTEKLGENVFLSTAKANIGHTEAASGLVGVLKSVLQLKHARIYPLPNFHTLNPQIQLSTNFKIPTQTINLVSTNKLCCGISSFGVGGTNACAILSKAEEINFKQQPTPTFKVLPISAKTKNSLQMTIEKINSLSFNQHMAPASALHRRHYNHRAAFISQQNSFKQVTFEKESIRLQILKVDQQPNKFWKTIPQCTDIYNDLKDRFNKISNNAHTDIIILLKFFKEVGVKRKFFDTQDSTIETILNFVYSNNFGSLLTKQHDNNSFGLIFNSSNNSMLINSVRTLEELIACLYISNSCEINWNFIYPTNDKNFLLAVAKKLPTYSFDSVVCWKTNRQSPVFDHPILGNIIEKDDTHFKLENYLSKHRLQELFDQKYITIGFVIEGLSSILQYLRSTASVNVNKWQFNNQVFVRQMWMFTEVELSANNTWRFHLLADGQTICKASGNFIQYDNNLNTTQQEVKHLKPIAIDVKKPNRFISSIECNNFHLTKIALSFDKIIKDVAFKPTRLSGNLRSMSGYSINKSEIKFYNDEHQVCSELCLNNKSTNKKIKEQTRQPAIHSIEEDQNSDELATKIAKLLQLSVADGLELSKNCYDVGFFDLGLDSLAMIGFANQMMEAQLPRLTTEELMTHSTINKLTAYIRQKAGFLTKTNNSYDSGYSSVLNDDSSNERKSSNQQIDKTQLIYRVLRNKEEVEGHFKFRVTFSVKRNDISIFFRYSNKRSELTFNALSTKIAELKPHQIELSFKMSNELIDLNQTSVSKLFLKLGNALINSNQAIEIHVKAIENLITEMAMSFLKSLCAEHPTMLSFCFHEKLQLIGKEKEERRVISNVWIVTGGTSGLGWQLSKHLLQKYSTNVILIARRQPVKNIGQEIKQFGERVQVLLADVSNKNQILAVFNQISQHYSSISIIHSAGIADDVLIQSQNIHRFGRVFEAKCKGLLNLKRAVQQYNINIDNWILNSSVSSTLGNVGQSNYSAANAFLDAFARLHPNACSINWANWTETGFASLSSVTDVLRKKGFYGLKTDEALACFDWILSHRSVDQIFVARVDWHQMFKFRPELRNVVVQVETTNLLQKELESRLSALEKVNSQTCQIDDIQRIEQLLEAEVKKLLKMDETEAIEKTTGFMELGLDSFGMFNLSNQINRIYEQNLVNIIHLFEHSTIKTLGMFIHQKLQNSSPIIEHSSDQNASSSAINNNTQQKESQPDKIEKSKKDSEEQEKTSKPTNKVKATVSFSKPLKRPNLVFLFGGNGSLYSGVCADLIAKVPFVEQQVNICSQHFQDHLKTTSIVEIIKQSKTDEIKCLPVEHAIIFTIGYTLAKFWLHVNLEPTHLIGHSLGEIIAVCIAGRLELVDAVHLVYLRAKALEKCKGAMMAVDSKFLPNVDRFNLSVAAINGPKQIVVSGSNKQIEKAKLEATKHGLSTKVISEKYAFHSKLVKDKYLKQLNHFEWSKVQNQPDNEIKIISNLNAETLTDFNCQYAKQQATSTVQFWKSIENLLTEGEMTVLEVGAGRILSSLTQKIINEHSLRYLILNTIQKDQENELDTLKWSAQKLELKGFSINQRKFSDAIGEDFVEQISNAFSSSFRLAKTGSLNAKHHRVTYQRRTMNPNSRRQSSTANLDGSSAKQQVENKQLILHRRQVEIDELDLAIISDHRLFDETIAPAAFHLKCFSEHLRLQQIHLKDVRLTSKILVDDLDSLVTIFDQGRLQLKQSGGDEKLFSSCLVEFAPEASETTVKLSQDQAEKMASATVPAELDLCGQEKRKRKPTVSQSEDDSPYFPDQDPGIWISPRKFYNGMAASGFCYDKHLQLLLDIRLIGLNRIRTRSQKPSASWVLFDLALQTLSAGLFDVRSTKCYIPVAIEEVYSNFPSDWTADGQGQWTFHGEVSKREGDLVEGSVWIFARGILIGHLKGIRAILSVPTKADIAARRDRRNAISTDDEFEGGDGTDKKKRRKSRSQHGHKKPKDIVPEQSQTKHASFSSTASELFEASRRKSSSTASKIALAVNNFKRTRLQRDFPLFKTKDSDDLLFVVRGSFGQFATDEVHPFFESISQQSHTHNVFMLEQRKTEFDAGFFGMTPKETKFIDPNQRFLLEATQRCLESANLKQLPSNCGVFIGSSSSDFAQKAFAELEDPNAYLMAGSNLSSLSGRLAHFFQANGPCLTIDTACSSFNTALSVACNFLSQQTCEWALVGASNLILNEKTTKVMQSSGMLSPSHRCASFDAEADGFVRSEGYGVILVEAVPKTKSHMLRNDSILIKGWSVGHTGGKSAGFLVPDPSAEANTMLEACQQSQIDLIECHGTGTSLGDPIEIEGIKRFLKVTGQTSKEIYLNSMKTYFGHCEASAGLASMLAVMEVMRCGKIPPLRHFNKLNPNIQLFENMLLPVETTEGNFQRVLINSFGFTGTNSSILLEKYGSVAGKKFNFNRAPVNKVPKAVFNREYLWPFNEGIKQVECKLLKYNLEFEETGFALNQLVERAKTICYCGRKFTKQSISIGRLKPALIKDLSEENLILIWSVNKKKLAEQSAKICRFLAHLKSNSFIDVVAPILFAPTVFALIRTCIAERNFRNMHFYAVDDQQLVLPKIKVDFFETSDKTVKFNKCLVTGGLGGIGQKLLEKLPAQQKLVIGRTCRGLINKKLPKNCKYWNCDVAERTQLERLFRSEPKIDLVVHCAGVVQNALLKNQDAKHFEQIFSAKVVGTKNLLKLCRQYGVRKLIVISSIAAIYGSVGQANYAVANAEMTRLIEKEESVECLSIALGPILDVGMLSSNEKQPIRQQIESSGWEMMCIDEVIKNILSILNETGQFIIASGSKLNKDSPQKAESVKTEKTDFYFDRNSIQSEVEKMLNEISGLKEVPPNRGLMSLGVDSLMIENLRSSLCQKFGIEITPAEIYEHTNLNNLIDFLKKKLELKAPTIFSADESSSTTSDYLSLAQEEQKIAIIGFSGRMPNSESLDDFFQQLMEGKELFTSVKQRPNFVNISSCLKGVNQFDFNFFDLSKEDAALLDPQIKVLLTVAYTVLEDAGYTQQRRNELKISCFTAAEPSEFEIETTFAKGSLHEMYAKNQKDFVAAWVSHLLGLKGSTNAVYSACSSSLVAIANAVHLLQTNKDVDMCLVGGINLVNEVGHQVDNGSPMSKNASSLPFSKQANGIIRGSACGVVLLKRLKDALNDNDCVLTTIKGIAVNNDANRLKSNFLAPSIQGQEEVMKECLASIEESTLDYVECHATGTIIGDAIEVKALKKALQSTNIQSTPFIGSVKANIGHAFAASGMASLAKCLKILKTRQIPPQIGIKQEDIIEEVDQTKLRINTTPIELRSNTLRLMINNFGIGGTNACMVIEEFEQEKKVQRIELKKQIENFYLLAFSAKSKPSCIGNCHKLAHYLRKNPTTDLAVLSNTLLNYRDQHEYRFAALVENVKDAVNQLKSVEECDVKKAESNRPFALYFGHQGLQYSKILQVEKEACINFKKIYNNYVPEVDENQLDNPSIASSFLFGVFGSVVEFLQQNGMHQPDVVFGHSLGEYGAMMASGALEFKEGLDFVARRGTLFEKTQKASMFAVQTDQDKIHDQLYLSAILSPTLRSFVCAQEVTKRVKEDLDKLGVQWKELRSDFGFHSQFMDPILVEFFNLSTKLQLNKMPLKFPIISNMDGQLIEKVDQLTPDYLTQHLRHAVRLDLTLNTLNKHFSTVDTIIEIGPSGILSTLLNKQKWNCVQTIQSYSQNKHQPSPFLFKAIAKLWELGFSMNLRGLFGSTNDILRGLPAYTFDEYDFKWPTKKEEKPNNFEIYGMIWKYCKQLKIEERTQKYKKIWLFTDSPSAFSTDFNDLFDKVFDIQSCEPDFDELPEVLLHICLNPSCENTFYFLHSLKNVAFTQQSMLISCGLFGNPINALSIGPLEELNRLDLKTIHLLFDDLPTMKNTIKNSLNQLLDLKSSTIPRFRCVNNILLQLDYTNEVEKQTPLKKKEVYLLIGGSGSLGNALVEYLNELNSNNEVIVLSRNPKKSTATSHSYAVDITNQEELSETLTEIKKKFDRIDCTFFIAGLKPSSQTEKEEMDSVIGCKVYGLLNLIKASTNINISLGSLVLCSSLSAVNGLPNIEDYCSANCFLDQQALLSLKVVKNVVSIQLPPLQNSQMLSASKNTFLHKNSIDLEEAAKFLTEACELNGTYALSNANPLQVRQFICGQTINKDFKADKTCNQLYTKASESSSERLIRIWKSLLPGLSTTIESTDEFFALGGNSLSALQLTWKIQEEFKIHVPMDKLMENPKFYELLNLIENNATKVSKIQRRTHNNNSGRLGLEQEQMWILGRISKPSTYNVVFKLNFDGNFDESRAFNALKFLMERQKVLRSRFFEKDGEPFQEIMSTEQALQNSFVDRKDHPIDEIIKQELSYEFDLSRSAFRFVVTKSGENFCVIINQQHIITDGFSITIFAEEFSHFYLNQNTPNETLPALEIDYIDYAEYSREHFDEQKCQEYANFLKQLPPQGTIIWPSSEKSTGNGQLEVHFDPETIEEIDLLCREFACTRFILVFSAFVRCVDRWRWRSKNEKEPIVVGCPSSGRNMAEVSKLIGYFLNNMVVCVDTTRSLQKLGLCELLDVIGNGMNQAHKYANIPFHKAVAHLNQSRNTADHQPVFQLFFNYRHQLDFPVINLGPNLHCNVEQLTNNNAFQLSCTVDELDAKRMKITLDYDQKTLNEKDVNCFAEELQKSIRLLRNINQLDSDFIHQPVEYSVNNPVLFKSVIELIFEQCRLRPDSIALQKSDKTQITYKKLKSQIEENAQHLMKKFYKLNQTPKADFIVPILLEMNIAIEWILAVLYCGLAYCPLDPSQPLMRTQMMVKKLGSSFIVSDQEVDGFDVLNIQTLKEDLKECVAVNNHDMFGTKIQPDHLAYAIFTSGSTGEPKTVCIEHKQLSAFVDRSRKQFLIDEHARIAHSVNIVFDVSIFNMFTTLTSGGCLIQKEETIDFINPNNNLQLTHLILSSAIFNALRKEQLLSLRKITNWVIVGGETPLDEALKTVALDTKISQFYGPTETTVWCAVNHYGDGQFNGKNIGYACQPFFLTTLDEDFPVPLDGNSRAVGELWICGDQVGRGYLQQTNDGFVENYMGIVGKSYRTGDLVRLVDQQLEFLGRRDHQFKINGMRVDPQEIVAAIQKYCDIQQVHVSLINNQLIAFIASVVTIKNEETLKTILAKHLPRYMVPANILQLNGDFPLNRNGKVDQQKLKEYYALKTSSATKLSLNEERLTENGNKLAAIWNQTINGLNLPAINPKSNFFELGGHSLSVLKLQTRIKEELAVELTFDQLYRFSNFVDQLSLIEEQFEYKSEIVQVIRECQNATASVYCIHAIGGTIYPYFSMSTLWPSECNIYAISYNIDYPANTLNQLAEFYYKQASILKHAEKIKHPFLLLGHSLGGIISWLIAALCLKNNQIVPIVCAFDSWVVDNNKLDEAEVLNYLKSRFETLEGAEKLINAALKLCQMLKHHQMEYCSVALNLFKAERLGETSLKHAIRKDLTEEMINAKMDNGWMEYVEELTVYPCDCDHDSIMEPKVLSQYVWLFEQLIDQTISK